MVGHTGVYTANETAVTTIDQCLNEVVERARTMGYETIITADHGNADNALNADETPNTTHSVNPVPFIYVTENKSAKVQSGVLADVASETSVRAGVHHFGGKDVEKALIDVEFPLMKF